MSENRSSHDKVREFNIVDLRTPEMKAVAARNTQLRQLYQSLSDEDGESIRAKAEEWQRMQQESVGADGGYIDTVEDLILHIMEIRYGRTLPKPQGVTQK